MSLAIATWRWVSVEVRVLPAGAGKEAGAAPIALQYIVGVQADGAAGFTDVVRCATTLGGSTTQVQYNDAGVSAGSGGRHHPHLLDDRELFVVARLEPAADTVAVARPTPAWSTRRDGCSSGRTPGRWAPR
jgi:hypothetical protein